MEEKEIVVGEEGKRIDIYLREKLGFSRSIIQELIKNGKIRIEGKTISPHHLIKKGEKIRISIPSFKVSPEKILLNVIYEDDSIILIDKPSGLIVHPVGKRNKGTLVNALLYYFPYELSKIGGETRRGIVHRLDKGTSGIMIIAKNDKTHTILSEQFRNREVKKIYFALVWKIIKENEGRIDFPMGRDVNSRKKMSIFSQKSKESITFYKVKERFNDTTLLKVSPKTGRTHQIRVHLSSIGHPIVGDSLYGGKNFSGTILSSWRNKIERPLLHAYSISFYHPKTGKRLTFTSPLPEDFLNVISFLRKQVLLG